MLTFILLVVLAGGVGLAAVSAAERTDPATPRPRTRRGDQQHPTEDGDHPDDAPLDYPAMAVAEAPRRTPNPELPRRTQRGQTPRSRTAVEGSFEAVAVASVGRRVVSLVILAAVTVGLAVVIAGSIGLSAAAVARIVDSAIG